MIQTKLSYFLDIYQTLSQIWDGDHFCHFSFTNVRLIFSDVRLGTNFQFSFPQMSDWDRFAAEEYELLVAEEGTAEPMDDM